MHSSVFDGNEYLTYSGVSESRIYKQRGTYLLLHNIVIRFYAEKPDFLVVL